MSEKLKNKPKEGMPLHKQIALGKDPKEVKPSKGTTK